MTSVVPASMTSPSPLPVDIQPHTLLTTLTLYTTVVTSDPDASPSREQVMDALSQLQVLMLNQLWSPVNVSELTPIIDILATKGRYDDLLIDLSCTLLSKCFQLKSFNEWMESTSVTSLLSNGASHPSPRVRQLVMEQFVKLMMTLNKSNVEIKDKIPVIWVLSMLLDDDLMVAEAAKDAFIRCVSQQLTTVSAPQSLPESICTILRQWCLQQSDVKKIRILELLVKLACLSDDMLRYIDQMNLLSLLHVSWEHSVDSADLLMQLSILEIIGHLGSTTIGCQYLITIGLSISLLNSLTSPSTDPIITGGILRQFAQWITTNTLPQPLIILLEGILLQFLRSEDLELVELSLNIVATLCCYQASYDIILNNMTAATILISETCSGYLAHHQERLRIAAMKALTCALRGPAHVSFQTYSNQAQQIYAAIPIGNVILLFKKYCEMPFMEVSVAGHEFFAAMVGHQWGVVLVFLTPGLLEYFLSSSTNYAIDRLRADILTISAAHGMEWLAGVVGQNIAMAIIEGAKASRNYARGRPAAVPLVATESRF